MVESVKIVHADIPEGMTCAQYRKLIAKKRPTLVRRLLGVVSR